MSLCISTKYISENNGWLNEQYSHDNPRILFQHHNGRFVTMEPLGGYRYLAQFNEAIYGNKVWPPTISNGNVKSVTVAHFVAFTLYEFVKLD